MKRFFIFNTGCIRRGLDSNRIYRYMTANGWEFTRNVKRANLVIVTTCGAVQEKEDGSLNAIRKVVKKQSASARVIISGCLPKINPEKIRELGDFEYVPTGELEKFDAVLGSTVKFESIPESNTIADNTDILNYVLAYRLFRNSSSFIGLFNRFSMRRSFLTLSIGISKTIGFVKGLVRFTSPQRIVPYFNLSIAEGCLGNCSFCAIRFATGKLRSKPIETIVQEFRKGLDEGYEYFQVVSEDTGCYGLDIGTTMPALLRRLLEVEGDYKLILIDFNPRWIVKYFDEIMPLFEQHQGRIREVFIPVQSGSDRVLKSMRRHYDIKTVKARLREMRRRLPRVRLRTTIIVGYPGETEEDFRESMQLVRDVGFYEVTINKYEDRPRTPSSEHSDKVARDVIDRRTQEILPLCPS